MKLLKLLYRININYIPILPKVLLKFRIVYSHSFVIITITIQIFFYQIGYFKLFIKTKLNIINKKINRMTLNNNKYKRVINRDSPRIHVRVTP